MAPKPKKSTNKPYKPNIYEQYENRRSFIIDTVETPADRKNLKKDLAKAKADYVIAKKDKQSRAAGTAYNPTPMTAAQKNKTKANAAIKAGRMTDRAVGTAKADALKKAAKAKVQRGVAKSGPIKPMIKKLTDSSDKATKKKR
jgi:hypothetical protein